VKEDEEALKRMKIASEPKAPAPKKRKLDKIPSAEPKVHDAPEKILSPLSPSVAKASEILKVTTIQAAKSSSIGTDQTFTKKGKSFGYRWKRRGTEKAMYDEHTLCN
jgi:hypothetical protein